MTTDIIKVLREGMLSDFLSALDHIWLVNWRADQSQARYKQLLRNIKYQQIGKIQSYTEGMSIESP